MGMKKNTKGKGKKVSAKVKKPIVVALSGGFDPLLIQQRALYLRGEEKM